MQYHLEPIVKGEKNGQKYCLKAQKEFIIYLYFHIDKSHVDKSEFQVNEFYSWCMVHNIVVPFIASSSKDLTTTSAIKESNPLVGSSQKTTGGLRISSVAKLRKVYIS